jgi:hypothetical protein
MEKMERTIVLTVSREAYFGVVKEKHGASPDLMK